MFYDLHVHSSISTGEDTTDELAEFAKKLGLGGIGIVKHHPDIVHIEKRNDIDIVNCVMIKADSAPEVNEAAKKMRRRAEVLMVHGGNYDVNRAACENSMIDVLCHPELGRKDSGLDHICARAAKENDVAIELNFRQLAESYGTHRGYMLRNMRRNVMLCKEYDAKIITCSGSVSKWNLRSGRDMCSLAGALGMETGKAIDTCSSVPEEIVRRNRGKLNGS